MALTEKQKSILYSFEVKRARELDPSILQKMSGPIINGEEARNIIDIFSSDEYLRNDIDGYLASFVVVSPTGLPMAFFSLRCGELFEKSSTYKMELSCNAYSAIRTLMSNPSITEAERDELMSHIEKAKEEGLSFEDLEQFSSKKYLMKRDELLEVDKDITRVHEVHPAIEIKLFGINFSANSYWKSLKLPDEMKMGETLFWMKVVDKIRQIMDMVGCEFVYLFAADNEPEGELVQYYRVRLNFVSDSNMSANKPHFDYMSQFLFQSVKDLFEKQKNFLDNFNTKS